MLSSVDVDDYIQSVAVAKSLLQDLGSIFAHYHLL